MTDDITMGAPSQAPSQAPSHLPPPGEAFEAAQARETAQARQAAGVACPYCETVNDGEAVYCAGCGKPLRAGVCPYCGSEIDLDSDFCEVCHRYVRSGVCSFCGAALSADDAYCPECGSPKGGIVCPTCNTLNDFAFCKQCGSPLTDEARALVAEMHRQPDFELLAEAARELDELNMQLPYASERDMVREQMNEKMRERILRLLAKDRGIANPVIVPAENRRMAADVLRKRKEEKQQQIADMLERMAIPPMASPAKARNIAMAQKPAGVRLAWVCNFKHAMHSSPCGCAKPQMGGKWIILGKNNHKEIKDDK